MQASHKTYKTENPRCSSLLLYDSDPDWLLVVRGTLAGQGSPQIRGNGNGYRYDVGPGDAALLWSGRQLKLHLCVSGVPSPGVRVATSIPVY